MALNCRAACDKLWAMASEHVILSGAGKAILIVCTIVGIVVALFVKEAIGYDGILWSAIFGGAGGGVGGLAGTIIAKISGQIVPEGRGRRR